MGSAATALIDDVRAGLAAAADPVKAPQMQAYMKSTMPYAGVPIPAVRRITKAVFAAHPLTSADQLDATVRALFDRAAVREEWYAAVQLAGWPAYSAYRTPERWPLYRHLITTAAWWDVVDEVAGNLLGPILLRFGETMTPVVTACIGADDLWLRWTSIIVQLNAKAGTDLDLLTAAIDANLADRDFFIRKAIGWALRQYARTDPRWVRCFVAERADTMSGLSRREATKHL